MTNELLTSLLHHCSLPTTGSREELLHSTLLAFSRIPYENLTKILAHAEASEQRWKQTPAEVVQGFIQHGTGGTCFPLTKTLLHFLQTLGYEAAAILADRRYGTDTHCAVLIRLTPDAWHLLDPGYMIFSPCQLPAAAMAGSTALTLRYKLPHGEIELRPTLDSSRIELYTARTDAAPRYRLTYKAIPVDEDEFNNAWDRSFSWEMMTYPILSVLDGDRHIYLQKNNLLIRSATETIQKILTPEQIALDLGPRLTIAPEVFASALKYVKRSA